MFGATFALAQISEQVERDYACCSSISPGSADRMKAWATGARFERWLIKAQEAQDLDVLGLYVTPHPLPIVRRLFELYPQMNVLNPDTKAEHEALHEAAGKMSSVAKAIASWRHRGDL